MTDPQSPLEPEPIPDSEQEPPPAAPAEPEAAPPPRKRRARGWIVAAAVTALLLCLGGVVAGIHALSTIGNSESAYRAQVEQVADQFMRLMMAHQPDQAFHLFCAVARNPETLGNLRELVSGSEYALFNGYQRLKTDNFQYKTQARSDSRQLHGQIVTAQGRVFYASGFTGHFDALLIRENNQWRLYTIDISVPPAKYKEPDRVRNMIRSIR